MTKLRRNEIAYGFLVQLVRNPKRKFGIPLKLLRDQDSIARTAGASSGEVKEFYRDFLHDLGDPSPKGAVAIRA